MVSYDGKELGKTVANNRGEWRIWAVLSQPVERGTLTVAAGREVKRFKDVQWAKCGCAVDSRTWLSR